MITWATCSRMVCQKAYKQVYNLLKHKGASMRLLVPSRLAYGKTGYGSGSVTNVNSRIAGNQSLRLLCACN
jgi:hypothetical protein